MGNNEMGLIGEGNGNDEWLWDGRRELMGILLGEGVGMGNGKMG